MAHVASDGSEMAFSPEPDYNPPSTDDDDSENEEQEKRPRRTRRKAAGSDNNPRTRVSSRRQPRKTYNEESSSDTDDDGDFASEVPARQMRSRKGQTSTTKGKTPRGRPRSMMKEPQSSRSIIASRPRRKPSNHPEKKATEESRKPTMQDVWHLGTPMPWATLPYEILREIISYASYPLFDHLGQRTPNVKWLLKLRNVHPILLEASLAVLYQRPPITNPVMAQDFMSLVSKPDGRTTNYNAKVKYLELEARSVLSYSTRMDPDQFDLGLLVHHLPQLSGIDCWSVYDDAEMRRKGEGKTTLSSRNWSYPESLFDYLSAGDQKLKEFHWNARFMAKHNGHASAMYLRMQAVHTYPSFQSLVYLKLTNFLGDSDDRLDLSLPINYLKPDKPLTLAQQQQAATRQHLQDEQDRDDELLAVALNALRNLKKLDLHLCSIVSGTWLQLLPKALTHLGIVECHRFTSDDFERFLASHGHHLQMLVLKLNAMLGLGFLSSLRTSCPTLKELEMDLTQFSKTTSPALVKHVDLTSLLPPDARPSWPKNLQCLQLDHMHHMGQNAAEVFLASLVESGKELQDLRHLSLSMSLDVSWRDRARIRDVWEEKVKSVFLRKRIWPNPKWYSIKGYHEWKNHKVPTVVIPAVSKASSITDMTPTEDDSERPATHRKRKASSDESGPRRLRPRRASKPAVEPEPEPVQVLGKSLRDMVVQALEGFQIQGKCDVVELSISNLRPRDEMFNESDFLDDELSGDEEWNEERGDLNDDELYPRRTIGR